MGENVMGEPIRLQFPPKREPSVAAQSMSMLGGPALPAMQTPPEVSAPDADGSTKPAKAAPKAKKGAGDGDAPAPRKRTLV